MTKAFRLNALSPDRPVSLDGSCASIAWNERLRTAYECRKMSRRSARRAISFRARRRDVAIGGGGGSTMYYTDDSILPENMAPLIITAAPYGPEWLPGDADIPLTWDEQVQAAVDCYNAGATMLHVHVRDPATGQGSVNFDQYNYLLAPAEAGRAEDDPAGRRFDFLRAAHRGSKGQVAQLRYASHARRTRPEAGMRHGRDRHDPMGRRVDVRAGRHQGHASRQQSTGAGGLGGHVGGRGAGLLSRAPEAPRRPQDPTLFRARNTSTRWRSSSGSSARASTWGR